MNPWDGKTVADMLDRSADRWPERTALVDGESRLTYRELRDRRDGLAWELDSLGIGEGTRVALFLGESWEHVVLFYALLQVGAVAIPVNLVWEPDELAYAIDQADAEILVCGVRHQTKELWAKIEKLGVTRPGEQSIDRLPKVRGVIIEDRDRAESDWHLQTLIAKAEPRPHAASERQESLLIFTSGSSAKPKAVVLRQDGILGTSTYFGERLGLDEDERFIALGPLYHVSGICSCLLPCHIVGCTEYIFTGFELDQIVAICRDEKPTALGAFDVVFIRLMDALEAEGIPFPFKKAAIAPGTMVHDKLDDMGLRLVMMYASSESGNMGALSDPSESERGRMSAGLPLPGVEMKICDRETRATLPAGEYGEICFRGWNRFVEYYEQPEMTAAVIDDEGYFHSGDYGFLDEEGRLYYRGRYSMMVKTGGENVSEIEVENYLSSNVDGIRTVQVVGAPDDDWGEIVVAFVELDDPELDGAHIREACKGGLAAYKIPRRYVQVDSWPVTPTGKIAKDELRERAAAEADSSRVANPGRS